MGLSVTQLRNSLDALAIIEPRFATALAQAGYPEPRGRDTGYPTLLRTIVGQQISFKAADAVWSKVAATVGDIENPGAMVVMTDEQLRGAGLSRQKIGYCRSLAELIVAGDLNLENLPQDDEEAIAKLTAVKGIGRWSAEVYLLFAEGRPDVWPAGDLAVQESVGRILGHNSRPSEKTVREVAEIWRPHRGAAAVFAWHHYKIPVI
ncbi:DNA-3-methyladenine glycosylase 2 family protein [Sphingomonas sp.]|uniref:DNA-3-methyladenine glycosylase family protein n=1 Tax=Sphingomonas sp. TaxID=28214 RepID=UPI0025EB3F6F|nr:DNA-3-methyladenine glycosylase 2 family protein [Sphingomonas sp.]